ncbi:MAG: hypothetical protein LBF49_00040 [Puniceicoccales bacterium]|jgi:hypothetical protein|nr:hypothetical protein [Puniceicoccales bacterium]
MDIGNIVGGDEIERRFRPRSPEEQEFAQFAQRVIGVVRGTGRSVAQFARAVGQGVAQFARTVGESAWEASGEVTKIVALPLALVLASMGILKIVLKFLSAVASKFLPAVVSKFLPASMAIPVIVKTVALVAVLAVIMVVVQKAWRAMPAPWADAVRKAMQAVVLTVIMLIVLQTIWLNLPHEIVEKIIAWATVE